MVGVGGERVSDEEVARAKPDVIVLAWAATGERAKPASTLRNPLPPYSQIEELIPIVGPLSGSEAMAW